MASYNFKCSQRYDLNSKSSITFINIFIYFYTYLFVIYRERLIVDLYVFIYILT